MDGAIADGGVGTIDSSNVTNAVAAAEFEDSTNATLASRDYTLRQETLTNTSGNWTVAVASNIATIDTIGNHGLAAGMRVIFDADWTDNSFMASSSAIIASVPSSTTFTIAKTQSNQSATTETDTGAGIIGQAQSIGVATDNEVPSAGVTADLVGTSRPQGAFMDQGALEYADSAPPDAPSIGHESPYITTAGTYTGSLMTLTDGDSNTLTVVMVGTDLIIRTTPTANVSVTSP